jgi:hypothetical protein
VGVLFEKHRMAGVTGVQDATRFSRNVRRNILCDDFVEAMFIDGKTLVVSVI